MEEKINWLQVPDVIMGGMILKRLNAVEILTSAQKVCTTWRRICKDPEMWKIIDMDHYSYPFYTKNDFDNMIKQAVHRSSEELMDIRLKCCLTNDLLDFISRCSTTLKSLCLLKCYNVKGDGLIHALKRLPCLETLDLLYISIEAKDIKAIGQSCSQLKSFKIRTRSMDCDEEAHSIGNSMSALRRLQLFGSTITGVGLIAILCGCRHLESLEIRRCCCLKLGWELEKLCRERIKDFKFSNQRKDYEFSDSDDFSEDYKFSTIFLGDDFDYYWL